MTRQQRIDQLRHSISGVWLDLLYRRPDGPELSIAIRSALTKVDQLCAKFYDEVSPEPKQPTNGAQPQKAVTK